MKTFAPAFLALCLAAAPVPAAALPVFDAGNYAQNLLQAARSLRQINLQIRSLQNETAMLRHMARDLDTVDFPEIGRLTSALGELGDLMGEARALGFRMDRLDADYEALFPGAVEGGGGGALATAGARLEAEAAAFRHSMDVQARVVGNIRSDAAVLARLATRSQRSHGSLQAQQATNQLLALAAKQQLQLQNLMAAQFRSEALGEAVRARAAAEGRAATRRFLGSGKAYVPR